MQILSKSALVDDNSLGLFGDEVDEIPSLPSLKKVDKPVSKPSTIRKSIQDYSHDESVEGIKDKYVNTSQGIDGFEDSIFLPNGEEVNGTWRLVDAFSISPSHDPFTFHSTKGFPRVGDRSANTRDYANEPDAQLQVIQLAGDFDGRALGFDSAVVVTKDGVVISGNNRTMSSQLAARKGTDKKYVNALMKRCRSFGFSPEQVQAFEHPRVVFEIDSQDYSPEHFDKYNQSDKKEQSEEARIVKFSKVVKPNVLRGIADIASRFQWDLTQVFAIPEACEEMMTVFIKNKVFSQAELPRYFDGNKVSSAGKQFLYEYILGGVLNESVVRALYAEGMGNLKQNVIGSVQLLLQNWACGSYSVIDELNSAIRYAIAFITDINTKKFVVPKIDKDEAKTMSAEDKVAFNLKSFNVWASQGDLLEDKHPLVLKLAGALVYSASLFKDYLTRLNTATASAAKTERETADAGSAGLFEEDFTPDRYSLLEKAVASWQRRNAVKRNILSSVLRGVSLFSAISKDAYFGCFIHKTGTVVELPAGFDHDELLWDDPDRFGVSLEEVRTILRRQGINDESDEYRELFNDLLWSRVFVSGWTRVRVMNGKSYIALGKSNRSGDRLSRAAFWLVEHGVSANDFASVEVWYGTNFSRNTVSIRSLLSGDERGFMMIGSTVKSQAVFSDLQDKIMKWTAQDPNNKKAYQQAMSLFRENFGKNPQTEKDAKVIMKTAQQMAKTGQVYSDDSFKKVAQQVMNEGGGQQQSQGQQTQTQQSQGNTQQGNTQQGQSSGGVSPQDPVALFKAIQALYKSGSISKEQVEKAFAMVTGGQAQQGQAQQSNKSDPEPAKTFNKLYTGEISPDKARAKLSQLGYPEDSYNDQISKFEQQYLGTNNQTQGNGQQQKPLAASFNPVKSSGKNPGVVFDRLPKGISGLQIGSRVVYNPLRVSNAIIPSHLQEENSNAGEEGIIRSIKNGLYGVEMVKNKEFVSVSPEELDRASSEEEILSARGAIADPMRECAQQFLSNIPSFTKVPTDYKSEQIVKEKLAPDHVCYWYSETIDNGKPYTVEFHVSPGEPFCDVYVVRDFDNTPLDDGGYHIEDFEDWNLSEVDYVEGLFAKEKASTGKEASFDKDKRGITPYLTDRVSAGFDRWSARVAAGLSLGKGMSLPDMAIVSGLARVLSGGSYVADLWDEKDYESCDLNSGKYSRGEWDNLYDAGIIGREEWYRGYDYNGNYELEDREQRPVKTSKGGFFGMGGSVQSSVRDRPKREDFPDWVSWQDAIRSFETDAKLGIEAEDDWATRYRKSGGLGF